MTSASRYPLDADKPSWLELVWMEVQDELDAEELGERMDSDPEFEDTNVEDSYGR